MPIGEEVACRLTLNLAFSADGTQQAQKTAENEKEIDSRPAEGMHAKRERFPDTHAPSIRDNHRMAEENEQDRQPPQHIQLHEPARMSA
jgi:hypothetical protein